MYHRDVDIRQRDLTTAAASFTCHQSRHRFVCLSSDYHAEFLICSCTVSSRRLGLWPVVQHLVSESRRVRRTIELAPLLPTYLPYLFYCSPIPGAISFLTSRAPAQRPSSRLDA
ncbi:hypothetical protein RRG08_036636 [Elysia crispata]|uniref:Uncharacterized protein n=1 Tax=Elysia crispata TaxID=231223 RepID=A0AAE1D2Y8_9GAST|nr:hypothetical protein RRG08_036636 [Elysia crispata]